MKYNKPFLSYEAQADKLLDRGMESDKAHLVEHLKDAGYYRLSGYWHIFKGEGGCFVDGTTFAKVWDLYTFDRQFRLTVLDAVERIEVYIRTQLAHKLAECGGPFGFLDHANLPRLKGDQYGKFIDKCVSAFRRSREPFALHFSEVYGDSHKLPPYWILVNLMDFGMVVTLYRGAPVSVRNEIADNLGVTTAVLDSWLISINTVRNICAHHGRLWNRVIGTPPKIPNVKKDARWHVPHEVDGKTMFGVLTVMNYLLSFVAPDTKWRSRLMSLMDSRTQDELVRMGFKNGWEKCPFWKPWLCD